MDNLKICPRCLYIPSIKILEANKCPCCLISLETTGISNTNRTIESIRSIRSQYEKQSLYDVIAWRYRCDHIEVEDQIRTTPIPGSKPIQQPPTPTLTTCPVCGGKLSTAATACPHCGQPMNQGKPVQAVQQAPAQPKHEENVPRCPTCNSTNIRKLDVIDRGLSFAVWGIFSSKIGKSMMCKDCGYKW